MKEPISQLILRLVNSEANRHLGIVTNNATETDANIVTLGKHLHIFALKNSEIKWKNYLKNFKRKPTS